MSDPKLFNDDPDTMPSAAHALMSKSPVGTAAFEENAEPAPIGSSSHMDAEAETPEQPASRPPAVIAAPSLVRPANLRRSTHALQLFGLLFVITLLLFGAMLAGM